jgi:prepilin-type N-terminal cleavage/methylation domain-containing protein
MRRANRIARDEAGFGLVEILITMLILSVGLLALTTISAGVASQTRISAERTAQAMAAQQVLEDYTRRGYAAATSGVDTVQISGRAYVVSSTVTDPSSRVRQVSSVVNGRGPTVARTYITRIYDPIPVP